MAEADPAARRFYAIQLTRLAGALMVVGAILALNGAIALPGAIAYLLLALGLTGFFIMPTFLARKWSSRRK